MASVFKNFNAAPYSPNGYAALTAMIMTLVISLIVLSGFAFLTLQEVRVQKQSTSSLQTRYAAESGLEDALYRFLTNKQFTSGEILAVSGATTTITSSKAGSDITFRAEGEKELLNRNLEIKISRTVSPVNFFYGAQAGDGGLEMEQNSQVVGSVYSDGSIEGDSGATITGDAFVASGGDHEISKVAISGNAQAHNINNTTVGKNATSFAFNNGTVSGNINADSISNCTINGNAAFNTKTKCTINGSQTTPTVPLSDLPNLPLPISTTTILQWENEAASGGTCVPPQCQANGDYAPTECSIYLGPKKITGNLILGASCSGGQTLTLTGTVWVLGNMDISNNAQMVLGPSYGANSGVVVTDGWIHLSNNGQFRGSGAAGSFLMLLTNVSGGGHHGSAIDLHNNASGAIFYAGNGMVFLHNNVAVTELAAKKIHLSNNATLTYDIGLQNLKFSSGPPGGVTIRSWKEVE